MDEEKLYVDSEPFTLFKKAEEDVVAINSLIKQKDVPDEYNYDSICYHATQAVEKFLKGFIISNNGKVKKSHNLNYIREIAESIDNSFSTVKNECLLLEKYVTTTRYDDDNNIEKQEIISALKALNKLYHFSPITKMREDYKKKENYIILPEFDFLKKEPEPIRQP